MKSVTTHKNLKDNSRQGTKTSGYLSIRLESEKNSGLGNHIHDAEVHIYPEYYERLVEIEDNRSYYSMLQDANIK